jgi:hypothetical protein
MTTTRNQATTALFELLVSSYAYEVSSRRFRFWDEVSADQKPALFLQDYAEEHTRNRALVPAQRTIMCACVIYIAKGMDQSSVPIDLLNDLIDAIDPVSGGVLKPDNIPAGRQTLGGLVYDCYIEGSVKKIPGDLDGQGMAEIPIKIIFNS